MFRLVQKKHTNILNTELCKWSVFFKYFCFAKEESERDIILEIIIMHAVVGEGVTPVAILRERERMVSKRTRGMPRRANLKTKKNN